MKLSNMEMRMPLGSQLPIMLKTKAHFEYSKECRHVGVYYYINVNLVPSLIAILEIFLNYIRCFSSKILLSLFRDAFRSCAHGIFRFNIFYLLFETAVWEFHVSPRQAMQILHVIFIPIIYSLFHISIDEERCYGLLKWGTRSATFHIHHGSRSVSVNYFHLHPLYFSALFFLHNTLHANHLSVFVVVWCIITLHHFYIVVFSDMSKLSILSRIQPILLLIPYHESLYFLNDNGFNPRNTTEQTIQQKHILFK
ncbi:hypothetical protein ACJX0J_038490 [Zea mays]